jgi:hypothetical protein
MHAARLWLAWRGPGEYVQLLTAAEIHFAVGIALRSPALRHDSCGTDSQYALDAADRVTLMEKLTSGAISAMESLRDSGALTG